MAPNPEQYAMSISKGEPYSFVPFVHHIDEFLDSKDSGPWLQTAKDVAKKIGISSSSVGWVGKKMLRMIMMNNIGQNIAQRHSQRTLSQ